MKARAVLALLALRANEPVGIDLLLDRVWTFPPPPTAVASARNIVSSLRRLLGDDADASVRTIDHGYVLRAPPRAFDVTEFAVLASRGRTLVASGDHDAALALLRQALDMWRGPALADLALEGFAWPEIAALDEQRMQVLELSYRAELALGCHREVLADLEQLVLDFPEREELHRARMIALYRCERRAEAADAYLWARAALLDALGTEPGHELQEMHRRLLAGQAPDAEWCADEQPVRFASAVVGPAVPAETLRQSARRADSPAGSRIPRSGDHEAGAELRHEVCAIAVLCVRLLGPGGAGQPGGSGQDAATASAVMDSFGGLLDAPGDGVLIGYFGLPGTEAPGDGNPPLGGAVGRAVACAMAVHHALRDDRYGYGDVSGAETAQRPASVPRVASVASTGTVMHIARADGHRGLLSWVAGEVVSLCEARVRDAPPGAIWVV